MSGNPKCQKWVPYTSRSFEPQHIGARVPSEIIEFDVAVTVDYKWTVLGEES